MKFSTQLTATSLFLIPTLAFAADCGLWYTSPCVCDTDIRYCKEGQNGASNDILDQHPIWAHMQGFYEFEACTFTMGYIWDFIHRSRIILSMDISTTPLLDLVIINTDTTFIRLLMLLILQSAPQILVRPGRY